MFKGPCRLTFQKKGCSMHLEATFNFVCHCIRYQGKSWCIFEDYTVKGRRADTNVRSRYKAYHTYELREVLFSSFFVSVRGVNWDVMICFWTSAAVTCVFNSAYFSQDFILVRLFSNVLYHFCVSLKLGTCTAKGAVWMFSLAYNIANKDYMFSPFG